MKPISYMIFKVQWKYYGINVKYEPVEKSE